MSVVIAIIVILFAAGGTSLVAEQAKPGDFLYPVKIQVNEEVREALAVNAVAKADVEEERAERRLEEAEEVAAQGKLTAEVRTQLEANFQAFADRVEARIKELAATNVKAAAEISAQFETALKAHARVLEMLAKTDADTQEKDELEHLTATVKTEQKQGSDLRAETETKVSAQASVDIEAAAEGRLTAAQNKLREVRAYLDRVKTRLGTEATSSAEAQLKVAESTLAQGQAKLDAKNYNEAFRLFSLAHRLAQEAKLVVETQLDLKEETETDIQGKEETSAGIKAEEETNVEARSSTGTTHAEGGLEIKVNKY